MTWRWAWGDGVAMSGRGVCDDGVAISHGEGGVIAWRGGVRGGRARAAPRAAARGGKAL